MNGDEITAQIKPKRTIALYICVHLERARGDHGSAITGDKYASPFFGFFLHFYEKKKKVHINKNNITHTYFHSLSCSFFFTYFNGKKK